eukprot:263429_1
MSNVEVHFHNPTKTVYMLIPEYDYFKTKARNADWDQVRDETTVENGLMGWVGFDDPATIKIKAQYARDQNLRGVMCWDMSGDRSYTLIDAAKDGFFGSEQGPTPPDAQPTVAPLPKTDGESSDGPTQEEHEGPPHEPPAGLKCPPPDFANMGSFTCTFPEDDEMPTQCSYLCKVGFEADSELEESACIDGQWVPAMKCSAAPGQNDSSAAAECNCTCPDIDTADVQPVAKMLADVQKESNPIERNTDTGNGHAKFKGKGRVKSTRRGLVDKQG